jgi:hypothetical protein
MSAIMDPQFYDDIKPYSSDILLCFKNKMTPTQCALQIRTKGFMFDEQTDLNEGSHFLENLKDFLWEQVRKTDELKNNLYIFECFDNKNSKNTRKFWLDIIMKSESWILSWLPSYYHRNFERDINTKIQS